MSDDPVTPDELAAIEQAAHDVDRSRVQCMDCGAWYPTGGHRWDDGLTSAGGRCRTCDRPRVEQREAEDARYRRQLREWAETIQSDAALAYVDRLDREAGLHRELPPDEWRAAGLMGNPEPFPTPGWGAFTRWRDEHPDHQLAGGTVPMRNPTDPPQNAGARAKSTSRRRGRPRPGRAKRRKSP